MTLIVTTILVFLFVIVPDKESSPRLEAIEATIIAGRAIEPYTGKIVTGCGAKSFDEESGLWTVDCEEVISGQLVETVWTVDDDTEVAVRVAPPEFRDQ